MSEDRFSEDEFALILRRASEIHARTSSPGTAVERSGGMSLEEIKGIAAEVGIDPSAVDRAAGAVLQERAARVRPLSDKFVLADSAPGQLTDEDKVRVLQAIRDAAQLHGEADLGPTGLEWSSPRGEPSVFHVSVHTIEGRNQVRVAVDRNVAAILTHLPTIVGGGLAGVATGAILEPQSVLVGIGLVAAGLGTGLTVARTLWRITSRKVRERAAEVLAATVAALPDGPGDAGGSGGPGA